MPIFSTWDIIKVPFPYTDRPVRGRRPALVVSSDGFQDAHGLVWVLMITSAQNRGWSGDVSVSELDSAGLPAASVVRTAKIATIEAKEAERIGCLCEKDRRPVVEQITDILSFH